MSEGPAAAMPQYQSHKKVWALQIDRVEGNVIHFVGKQYAPKTVDSSKLFHRYTPVHGDYLVTYDDGYESISPRKAFEEGYARIGG